MKAPLIGITTGRMNRASGQPFMVVPEAYVQAVSQAGGCPVLIPLGLPDSTLLEILSHCSGLLLTGGGDVDPNFYGAQPHPKIASIDPDRDRVEIQLLQACLERGQPLLGICRGLQVINVALGGTLYADLLDQRPGSLEHDQPDERPRDFLAHTVRVEEGSQLASILGIPIVEVNSLHHQAIDQLAPSLRAAAFAPDGLVEAVELPGPAFRVAVQWHPECLLSHEPMRALFRSFVEAAK